MTFTAQASGVPEPAYQWRHDEMDIPGATGASYSIPSATYDDALLALGERRFDAALCHMARFDMADLRNSCELSTDCFGQLGGLSFRFRIIGNPSGARRKVAATVEVIS